MGLRTVRLDEEAERTLRYVVKRTGLSISRTLANGVLALRDRLARDAHPIPYDVYAGLDLGPGGYAVSPSTQTRQGVRTAIQRKLRRRR